MLPQTIKSSLVQVQAMVDIRADVLLSINGADTVASLHAIGKATVLQNATGRMVCIAV